VSYSQIKIETFSCIGIESRTKEAVAKLHGNEKSMILNLIAKEKLSFSDPLTAAYPTG